MTAGSETYGRPSSRKGLRSSSLGRSAELAHRQEAVEREFENLFAQDLGLERAADQRRAAAEHGDLRAGQSGIGEQSLLGRRALPAQTAALANRQGLAELRLHQPRQREIEVVAAQQQMLAHGGAREIDAVAFARDADQREVAGAAADVAHQHRLAVEQALLRAREIVGDPGIERRGGFFEQRQLFDAGFARGHDGELAGLFVEAGGDGQHHVVFGDRRPTLLLPRVRQVFEDARGDFDRRQNAAAFLRVPRQDLRGAVDRRVRQPALGGVHALGGHDGALLARIHAGVFLVAQIQERRQRAARLDAALRHVLRDVQHVNGGVIRLVRRIDEGQRGVGGAEVDSEIHLRGAEVH